MYAFHQPLRPFKWIVACVVLVICPAFAQHAQLLTQTSSQNSGLTVDGTDTLEKSRYELAVGFNYARRPVLERFGNELQPLYGGIISPTLALTYGFDERLQLTVLLPWHRVTNDSSLQPSTTHAFGAQARWRVRSAIEGRGLSGALVMGLNAPFVDEGRIVSAGGALVYGRTVWQLGLELVTFRLNFGYEYDTSSPTALTSQLGGAHAITMGGSSEVRGGDGDLAGFFEVVSKKLLPSGETDVETLSTEAIAGLRLRSQEGVAMSLGAGRGLSDGFGAAQMRILFQLNWQFARFGFSDAATQTGVDLDRDGIDDAFDACPKRAEDHDHFEDADGCPDPDNDHDGILDANDDCPDESEDRDGFRDEDGCPDTDNDRDGVPDESDACPDDGASSGGKVHANGCPLIQIHGERLNIATPIQFASGSSNVDERADRILMTVIEYMRLRPPTQRLRIEGYTDSWGSHSSNLQLAKERAENVRSRLIELGFDSERVEAFGRATESLIGDGKSEDAAKRSRRVEFYLGLSERKRSTKEHKRK